MNLSRDYGSYMELSLESVLWQASVLAVPNLFGSRRQSVGSV